MPIINLQSKKNKNFNSIIFFSFFILLIIITSLLLIKNIFAQENNNLNDLEQERINLEKQLKELEEKIDEYEKTIEQYRKQGNTLKNEITKLETEIKRLNLLVKATNLQLEKIDQEIKITQKNINNTELKIEQNKLTLKKTLKEIYENDRKNVLEIILIHKNLSDFFSQINNIIFFQEDLKTALKEISDLRDKLVKEKEELSLKYQDTENLKKYQLYQKTQIEKTQQTKNKILQETKGKESEYQKILQKTKETAAQIRKRIFQLLGGGELTFEEAYKFASLAEKATNVRAALILAILDRESLFGKNVGRCLYNQKTIYAETAMNPKEIPIFLEIINNLKNNNINPPEPIYVSCPNSDGTYGGAMGPAQFIPSTWKLYEKRILEITGNNPPNPWNNADAFVATALYLKDALNSQGCIEYSKEIPSQRQTLLERCAAAKYYAGSRWYTYRFIYGDPVVKKANKFEEDIKIITQNNS